MSTNARTDKSHEVRYPTSADGRGSTRIHYLRKPYYLGPFESPLSYVMFGLWKHKLQQSGVAPDTKELRPIADAILKEDLVRAREAKPKESPTPTVVTKGYFSAALVVATAYLGISILIGAKFISSGNTAIVDDVPLSADEMEYIRGMRSQRQHMQHLVSTRTRISDVAEYTKLLNEERPKDAIHRQRKQSL